MKKLCLLVVFALSMTTLNSCSGDDSGSAANKITAKINGVNTTFDIISVAHDYNTIDGVEYDTLTISAGSTSSDTVILFSVDKGEVGANTINSMRFTVNGVYYYGYEDTDYVTSLSVNSATGNRLKGTFSGTIHNGNNGNIPVTNGMLDFNYE